MLVREVPLTWVRPRWGGHGARPGVTPGAFMGCGGGYGLEAGLARAARRAQGSRH